MGSEGQHQSPLFTFPLDDIEEIQEEAIAQGWDIRYTQYDAGRLNGVLKEVRLPGLLIAHEDYGRGFSFNASLPKDFTPALFPLRSREGARMNGLPYAPGDIFIPRDVSEMTCGGPQGIDLITLHLEPEAMGDLAAMLGQNKFDDLLRWAMVRHQGAPEQRAAFEGFLASLLQEDTWSSAANTNANAMTAVQSKIIEDFAALLEDAGPVALPSRSASQSTRTRLARQARAYLEANLDRAVSLAELCRFTGASARALQYAFGDLYGVSPQSYHRVLRLNAVRQSLQRQWPGETTVTDAAFGQGFWHLGRFSQAYKQRFGETPSETLARRPLLGGTALAYAR